MASIDGQETGFKVSAATIQETIEQSLRECVDQSRLPRDFLQQSLQGQCYDPADLRAAVEAIYRRAYYQFSSDLELDPREKESIRSLASSLDISAERACELNYQVGLGIYGKAFREAVADGDLTADEQRRLDAVAQFFELRKRDIYAAISEQALWYYSFKLMESLRDGVLTREEMASLQLMARRFGLTAKQLSRISVPEKKAILRVALTATKARGAIDDDDREYIRSLTEYLNAQDLLKACLMDLDLYQRLHELRNGELDEIDPGHLILEQGEHLHIKVAATYQYPQSGKMRKAAGTLYVGSVKLRFVGRTRSHEIRYKNIMEVSCQHSPRPTLLVTVSSGKGTGAYILKKKDPGAVLELKEAVVYLIRKARRMIEPREAASAYIPEHVRSEVYARDGGVCVLCGAREYLEFDHIIPRSKGGDTSIGNLQLLCRRCNAEKSDRI